MESLEKKLWNFLPDKAPIMSKVERYYMFFKSYGKEIDKERIRAKLEVKRHYRLGMMKWQRQSPYDYIYHSGTPSSDNFYTIGNDCLDVGYFTRALRYFAEDNVFNFRAILDISQRLNLGKKELKTVIGYIYNEKIKLREEISKRDNPGGAGHLYIYAKNIFDSKMSSNEDNINRLTNIKNMISLFERSN